MDRQVASERPTRARNRKEAFGEDRDLRLVSHPHEHRRRSDAVLGEHCRDLRHVEYWRRSIPPPRHMTIAPQFVHTDGEWTRTSSGSTTRARFAPGGTGLLSSRAPRSLRCERARRFGFPRPSLDGGIEELRGLRRCVARDRRGARSARRSLRASGRSRRPASRRAPKSAAFSAASARMQPDRSGKSRQSELPTIPAPSTRRVEGLRDLNSYAMHQRDPDRRGRHLALIDRGADVAEDRAGALLQQAPNDLPHREAVRPTLTAGSPLSPSRVHQTSTAASAYLNWVSPDGRNVVLRISG